MGGQWGGLEIKAGGGGGVVCPKRWIAIWPPQEELKGTKKGLKEKRKRSSTVTRTVNRVGVPLQFVSWVSLEESAREEGQERLKKSRE